jgi:hypothetical protein
LILKGKKGPKSEEPNRLNRATWGATKSATATRKHGPVTFSRLPFPHAPDRTAPIATSSARNPALAPELCGGAGFPGYLSKVLAHMIYSNPPSHAPPAAAHNRVPPQPPPRQPPPRCAARPDAAGGLKPVSPRPAACAQYQRRAALFSACMQKRPARAWGGAQEPGARGRSAHGQRSRAQQAAVPPPEQQPSPMGAPQVVIYRQIGHIASF